MASNATISRAQWAEGSPTEKAGPFVKDRLHALISATSSERSTAKDGNPEMTAASSSRPSHSGSQQGHVLPSGSYARLLQGVLIDGGG
ncbi:uncharacterized protein MYCGRDRAFT_104884 [Zymoseptoria tritici IPO323]|uniref:Uncharacterized protein n=1 Tax=Zymoseptoria tritici (strain CBS 115943 / IPO323) TaxID=336722 RepID=F9XDJ4_ZYMTI|nr:uncharacterized protein MYCGRDRAFT_104884 [Zymoseptoria tritici IPO323]EGP86506.1 hypothetical protein MYCGRDRAFT_104884 [Zymoseptoria tritici IPO323]